MIIVFVCQYLEQDAGKGFRAAAIDQIQNSISLTQNLLTTDAKP